MKYFSLISEFIAYFKERRKFSLLPVVGLLLLLGLLIALTANSALAPFIYTIF